MGKTGGGLGWRYLFAGPSQSYIWGESGYAIHPEWELPVIRTGKDALRTHTEGEGHTVAFQDVAVQPDTRYVASVWVRASDFKPGEGFGARPGDSAGLLIQELDGQGGLIATHPKVAVTKPCDYTRLQDAFRTTKRTATVRFLLDTTLACRYDQGHVTYDDCALAAEPTRQPDGRE